jgi:hypothetical protein
MADLRARAEILRRRAAWCREMARRTTNPEVTRSLEELADELDAAAVEMEQQSGENAAGDDGRKPESAPR